MAVGLRCILRCVLSILHALLATLPAPSSHSIGPVSLQPLLKSLYICESYYETSTVGTDCRRYGTCYSSLSSSSSLLLLFFLGHGKSSRCQKRVCQNIPAPTLPRTTPFSYFPRMTIRDQQQKARLQVQKNLACGRFTPE